MGRGVMEKKIVNEGLGHLSIRYTHLFLNERWLPSSALQLLATFWLDSSRNLRMLFTVFSFSPLQLPYAKCAATFWKFGFDDIIIFWWLCSHVIPIRELLPCSGTEQNRSLCFWLHKECGLCWTPAFFLGFSCMLGSGWVTSLLFFSSNKNQSL